MHGSNLPYGTRRGMTLITLAGNEFYVHIILVQHWYLFTIRWAFVQNAHKMEQTVLTIQRNRALLHLSMCLLAHFSM